MNRQLEWSARARAELDAIGRRDPQTAGRIRGAMQRHAAQNVGDVVKLKNQGDLYRLRVGDWRVIFTYEEAGLVVLALRVLRRNEGTYR